MRILWLPHQDWAFIRRGQREFRLAGTISDRHEVQFLTWLELRSGRSGKAHPLSSLRTRTFQSDGYKIHQARRVPNVLGSRVHETSGRGLRVNEWLHQRAVRDIVAREHIDLVICGISHQAVGLPPADLDVPLVFDYLDFKLERWPQIEAEYMARVDAVLCTSQVLVERTSKLHPHCYYVPNGVSVDAAEQADGQRVRRQYGLNGHRVVSLIGLTASHQLFYVDALAAVAEEHPDLVFLMVGEDTPLSRAMSREAEANGVRTIVTGEVSPSEVADFFAATDVGLYPGDQNAYFDAASPLKILEYTAAGKPVVATDLAELRNWGFPNVRLAPANAQAFHREIRRALDETHALPDLEPFTWSSINARLLSVLDEIVARGKR